MICHICKREMVYKGIDNKGNLVYLCPCGRVEVKEKKKGGDIHENNYPLFRRKESGI